MAEIVGPDGRVRYRRPIDHIDVTEALVTPGYSVRLVEADTHERKSDGDGDGGAQSVFRTRNFSSSRSVVSWTVFVSFAQDVSANGKRGCPERARLGALNRIQRRIDVPDQGGNVAADGGLRRRNQMPADGRQLRIGGGYAQ
jgi:hypothetical protein